MAHTFLLGGLFQWERECLWKIMARPLNEISDIFGGTIIHGDDLGLFKFSFIPFNAKISRIPFVAEMII